jgi:hypothetical protein
MMKSHGKYQLSLVLVFVVAAGLIMSGAIAPDLALAGKAYHKIGPIHLYPHGRKYGRTYHKTGPVQLPAYDQTYGRLSGDWWQWLRSIPGDMLAPDGVSLGHPLIAQGKMDCSLNQPAGPVWFLAGTESGDATRSCVVPEEKALFFPLVNAVFYNAEGEDYTVAEKREALNDFLKLACRLDSTLDGTPTVYSLATVRIQSPPFLLETATPDIWGEDALVDPEAVADGFWVMVPPLDRGKHVLQFTGSVCDPDTGEPWFTVNVTYNLFVR